MHRSSSLRNVPPRKLSSPENFLAIEATESSSPPSPTIRTTKARSFSVLSVQPMAPVATVQQIIQEEQQNEETSLIDLKAQEAIQSFTEAQKLVQQKNYKGAIPHYDVVVQATINMKSLQEIHAKALFMRAQAKKACGDFDEAYSDFTQAIQQATGVETIKLHQYYYARANLLNAQDKAEDAIKDYDQVLKLLIEEERNGGDVKKLLYAAYHNRGLAQRSAKRLSSAINDFERALTYLSENEMAERGIDTLYQLARANHEHRDYVQAMECYKRVVHINPAYSMASYYLGNLLFDNAHYKEAISSFSKAIAKDPKDHISLFNRGMCYDYLDKNKESVEDFERVINLAPDYSKAYAELAKALYKRDGDDVDARRMLDLFETAADKSLTDEQITKQEAARIFFDRGVLLNKTDILGEAVASFTEALRLDDQLLDAYFNRGIIYRELNNLEEALQDFEHVLRLDQNDIGALSERGLIYLRTNHLQKALDDFMRMAEIDPNNPNALQLIEYTREEMEKEQL